MKERILYDPKLDMEFPPDEDFNNEFSSPPELVEKTSVDLDKNLFENKGRESAEGVNGLNLPGGGSDIFTRVLNMDKQKQQEAVKKGSNLPDYVKSLVSLREEEDFEEEDFEDEDVDFEDGEFEDEDFEEGGFDEDFGEGISSGGFDDTDSDVEMGDEDGEEFLTDDFDNEEDILQTQEWREEQEVDEELAKIFGKDSPYLQGTSKGNQYIDEEMSSTYQSAMNGKGGISDDTLLDTSNFSSGGFLETYEDGFVYISGEGHSLAFAQVEETPDKPSDIATVLLLKDVEADDEGEIVIPLPQEDLDNIIDRLQALKQIGNAGYQMIERARKKVKKPPVKRRMK